MSKSKLNFFKVADTPDHFDIKKFKGGDIEQVKLYKNSKTVYRKTSVKCEDILKEDCPNFAREVPKDCVFIDFDDKVQAEKMREIILHSKLRCLILTTQHGYHFLFRKPEFYRKEMTGATNWFGYKFDTKGPGAVQIIKVCGMKRKEVCSWDLGLPSTILTKIDTEKLDVLPYWLWGKGKDEKLFKNGQIGKIKDPDTGEELATHNYKIDDSPFTKLIGMSDGGRHNYIFSYCRTFALYNGFLLNDFKAIIHAIHDEFLVKIGTPMSDSDLLGDVDKGWEKYTTELTSIYHGKFDKLTRAWSFAKESTKDKLDERRAAEWLYNQYDFYVRSPKANGLYNELLYKEIDGNYKYQTDLPTIRETLKEYSDQCFRMTFFEEVEKQLMQMCAENDKVIARNDKYIIVKNKVLSCINGDAYDFSWLGTKPPTDVVLPWTWYPIEWVREHEKDLGANITKFIRELARNASGKVQEDVVQWLWIVAGASMIPANQLQKIVILSGGGQNGKSLYTSLIRLCLGEDMFNESKIFDSNPHESFWGEGLDKGILCVIDDLNRIYCRDAFSYIKGALTGTGSVTINEKHKPKKQLNVLPQIIACTNFDFELFDKSEGMERRIKILGTEYHVDDSVKDNDLQYKLVLNTTDTVKIAEYKMSNDAFDHKSNIKIMHLYPDEKCVLDSLSNGSLAWFANKARYMYLKWANKELVIEDGEKTKILHDYTFRNNYEVR